jgi:hypothetical protein
MSVQTEQQRLEMPAHPLPAFERNQDVRVFMGAGWAKGKVIRSDLDGCTVRLPQLQKTVSVRDARNILLLPSIHDC